MQARSVDVRIVGLLICHEGKQDNRVIECKAPTSPSESTSTAPTNLYIVLFPSDKFPITNQFWQHSGQGISSRFTDHCLSMLTEDATHTNGSSPSTLQLEADHKVSFERRYSEPLLADAAIAKRSLRQRIAGLLVRHNRQGGPFAGRTTLPCGFVDITENDVYLFPTGMTAIWNAHQLALAVRPTAKSVCFGSAISSLHSSLPPILNNTYFIDSHIVIPLKSSKNGVRGAIFFLEALIPRLTN